MDIQLDKTLNAREGTLYAEKAKILTFIKSTRQKLGESDQAHCSNGKKFEDILSNMKALYNSNGSIFFLQVILHTVKVGLILLIFLILIL